MVLQPTAPDSSVQTQDSVGAWNEGEADRGSWEDEFCHLTLSKFPCPDSKFKKTLMTRLWASHCPSRCPYL